MRRSANGWLTHTWDWSDIVKQLGYERFFWVAEVEREVRAVFPAFIKSYSKLGRAISAKVLVSSALGYGGVCVDPNIQDKSRIIDMIIDTVDHEAASIGLLQTQVTLQPFVPEEDYLRGHHYAPRHQYTLLVDLEEDTNQLWRKLDKRARNGVRKAEKSGVRVREAATLADFDSFYSMHVDTYSRTGMQHRPYAYFKAYWDLMRPKGLVRFLVAEKDRAMIACNMVLCYRGWMLYGAGASDVRYKTLNAGSLLQWHTMTGGKQQGLSKYDLGTVAYPRPRKKEASILAFKSQWGGTLIRCNSGVKFYSRIKKLAYDFYTHLD